MEINYLYKLCALKQLSSYMCMLSMLSYVLSMERYMCVGVFVHARMVSLCGHSPSTVT